MAFRINHIHLKAPDPRKTADWYVRAFNFKILSDEVRVFGDLVTEGMERELREAKRLGLPAHFVREVRA